MHVRLNIYIDNGYADTYQKEMFAIFFLKITHQENA